MYVAGQNPTLIALNAYVIAICNLIDEPQMFKHEDVYFVIKLFTKENMNLYVEPKLIIGKPMIVKQWTVSFSFHKEVLRVVPTWGKVPNLPLMECKLS